MDLTQEELKHRRAGEISVKEHKNTVRRKRFKRTTVQHAKYRQ